MLNKKVSEIMTKDVLTVNPDLDVVNAFEKLMEHKISALPVVDDDVLVGIITATDVGHNLILDKFTWKNIKYTTNKTTNEIEEEVAGTFTQFPLYPLFLQQ